MCLRHTVCFTLRVCHHSPANVPPCFAWTEASKEHQSNRRLSFELLAFLYASGVEDCSKLPVVKYPLC